MTKILSEDDLRNLENCKFHRSAKIHLPEHFTPGETFMRVHFRLDTPSYRVGGHPYFMSDEDRALFEERFDAALEKCAGFAKCDKDGYQVRGVGASPQERLYVHPDSLSGYVALESVRPIMEAINSSEVSKFRWLDVYKLFEILDDQEIQRRLTYYEPQIIERLLAMARTGRKNRFVLLTEHVIISLADQLPGLHFIGPNGSFEFAHPVAEQWMGSIISQLVEQGLLVSLAQNGMVYYRTALKGEMKKIKRADRGDYWELADQLLSAA